MIEEIFSYILPAIVCLVGLILLVSKRDLFSEFLCGAKEGMGTAIKLAPTLVALIVALKMLSAAGLNNVEYDTLVESELPEGTVVEQSVEVGQSVPITEKIVLSISSGPKPQEVTLEHTFALLADMGDAYSVKITKKDTGEAVFDSTINGTESSVTVSLTGTGTVTYEVYINGIYFKEEAVEFTAP